MPIASCCHQFMQMFKHRHWPDIYGNYVTKANNENSYALKIENVIEQTDFIVLVAVVVSIVAIIFLVVF